MGEDSWHVRCVERSSPKHLDERPGRVVEDVEKKGHRWRSGPVCSGIGGKVVFLLRWQEAGTTVTYSASLEDCSGREVVCLESSRSYSLETNDSCETLAN